jgi:hypothetical protein
MTAADTTEPIGRAPCPDCGKPIARQCGGHTTRDGKRHRCHRSASRGTRVCTSHGAAAPHVRAAAARRLSEADALKVLARLDLPPMTDPLTALGELASLAMAMVHVAREQLAELQSMVGPDHLGDERPRAMILLLGQFMDRAQKNTADLARLNLDERIAEMHARSAVLQGELMAGLMRAVLGRLGLSAVQLQAAPRIVAEEFRALEARGGNGGS